MLIRLVRLIEQMLQSGKLEPRWWSDSIFGFRATKVMLRLGRSDPFFLSLQGMNVEKYSLKAESSLTIFEFVSEGPNGLIRKIIQFQLTNQPNLYNLAFGDRNEETGEINDLVVSNNGDTEKVLATVVAALYAFFDRYPDVLVYATGSTKARTRLYRMGITRFYEEMSRDFDLYGQMRDEFYEFEVGREYVGFLAQRK